MAYYLMHRGWQSHAVFGREPFSRRDAWIWLIEEASFKPRKVNVKNQIITLQRGQLIHSLRFMAKAWDWNDAKVRRFLKALQDEDMIRVDSAAGHTRITVTNYKQYQFDTVAATDAPSVAAKAAENKGTQQDRVAAYDAETVAEASQQSSQQESQETAHYSNGVSQQPSQTRKNGSSPPVGTKVPTSPSPGDEPPLLDGIEAESREPPERPPDKPKRATSLPSDWHPTSEDIHFARQEGMNEQEIDREADRFRDYWHSCGGQRGRKKDWRATWRNWIRKAVDDRKRQAHGGQAVQGRSKPGGIVASAHRLLSETTRH